MFRVIPLTRRPVMAAFRAWRCAVGASAPPVARRPSAAVLSQVSYSAQGVDTRGILAQLGELPGLESYQASVNEQETPMAFNPKDAVDAAKDIATNAVEKASDIVEDAGDMIRGDVKGGASNIVQHSIDIATHAVERTKEVFTGKHEVDE
jgi:hypothetical protein